MTNVNIQIRDAFFNALYTIAKKDKRVILVTADCGAPSLDRFREELRGQYYTVGIAEQNMISVAAGLALEGRIVYVYAIAPFATLRCYEQIKVDLCCMSLPVTILGVGAGLAYDIMGPTHHTTEDISIMRALPNMTIFNPSDNVMAGAFARLSYELPGPKYVRFDRAGIPVIYDKIKTDFSAGMTELKRGRDICIVATGVMTHTALKAVKELQRHSINAGVIDLYRLKPVDEKMFLGLISDYGHVVTLEEHLLAGGLGSIVSAIISDNDKHVRLKRIGICDKYNFEYGGRERLHELCRLDIKSLVDSITRWFSAEKVLVGNE